MDLLEYRGRKYPAFQGTGNAARFALPFAMEICKGVGYDIGYGKEEWLMPGAIGIEISGNHTAMFLPKAEVDFIFSSHCLEHLNNWVSALDHWTSRIKSGGHIFLYLPDRSQRYWAPWNNRKHVHVLDSAMIQDYMEDSGKYRDIYVGGVDLNNSFTVTACRI